MRPLLALLALTACKGADPAAPESPADSGAALFSLGDPVLTVGNVQESMRIEWMDAAIFDENLGLVVGQGGFMTMGLDPPAILAKVEAERAYRVAVDGHIAYLATRIHGVYSLDLSDPSHPWMSQTRAISEGFHEDIAADAGRVLVGALDDGAILLDPALDTLGVIPASYAFGVALQGDRALVADDDALVLWDISDPAAPVELNRAALRATGRDIAWQGEQVAVAMGGQGVAVFSLAEDTLEHRGDLEFPGTSYSVSIDGDDLWIAGWEVAALAWLGEGGPVVRGHEPVQQSAMGVSARDGEALVADWMFATVLSSVPGVAGPELHVPERIGLGSEGASVALPLRNWGALPMEITLEAQGVSVSGDHFNLAPGEQATPVLTGTGSLKVRSDDPDEGSLSVDVYLAELGIGSPHPDFDLAGFTWPDRQQRPYRLADAAGQVLMLAYFTTW